MRITVVESASEKDARGFTARPVSDEQLKLIYNVHIVELEPGAVRGNHYHERQTEKICVLGGPVKFLGVDNESGERAEFVFDGESCPSITVSPGVTHALKNTGTERIFLLCFSDRPLDSNNPDVVRNVILE